MVDVEPGDRIEWEYGRTIFGGAARGEVVETGLSKFGHNDVIRVDPDGSMQTFIRSEDVTRVL